MHKRRYPYSHSPRVVQGASSARVCVGCTTPTYPSAFNIGAVMVMEAPGMRRMDEGVAGVVIWAKVESVEAVTMSASRTARLKSQLEEGIIAHKFTG